MTSFWLQFLAIISFITFAHVHSEDRIPPVITTQPETTYFDIGQPATLRCAASGSPAPLYTWKKGEIQIINQTVGDYNIVTPTDSDAGNYTCLASNVWGTAISRQASLIKAYINSFTDRGTNTNPQAIGSRLSLACRGPPPSTPSAKYSWAHVATTSSNDFEQFQFNERIQTHDDTGTIYIANAQSSDRIPTKPLFACQATNGVLATTKTGSFWNVTWNGNTNTASFLEPAFKIPDATEVIALEGQSVKLRCFYYGLPTPVISWERVMTRATTTVFNTTDSNTTTVVSNISMSDDQTMFYCYGRNTASNSPLQQQFRITVHVVPVFDVASPFPPQIFATVGTTATVDCNPRAVPSATVVWLANGRPLDTTTQPRYTLSNNGKTLTISSVCLQCSDGSTDMKVITCNASNEHGYLLGTTFINVLEPTSMTSSREDQSVAVGLQAVFGCSAQSDALTPITFTWLHNGTLTANGSETSGSRIYAQNTANSSQLYIDPVQDNDNGAYTCVASNGYSQSSIESQLVVLPPPYVFSAGEIWWVFLIIGILLLLLILIVFLYCYCKDNDGDTYPVDEVEIKNGNNPDKELRDTGFLDFQPPRATSPNNYQVWTVGSAAGSYKFNDATSVHTMPRDEAPNQIVFATAAPPVYRPQQPASSYRGDRDASSVSSVESPHMIALGYNNPPQALPVSGSRPITPRSPAAVEYTLPQHAGFAMQPAPNGWGVEGYEHPERDLTPHASPPGFATFRPPPGGSVGRGGPGSEYENEDEDVDGPLMMQGPGRPRLASPHPSDLMGRYTPNPDMEPRNPYNVGRQAHNWSGDHGDYPAFQDPVDGQYRGGVAVAAGYGARRPPSESSV